MTWSFPGMRTAAAMIMWSMSMEAAMSTVTGMGVIMCMDMKTVMGVEASVCTSMEPVMYMNTGTAIIMAMGIVMSTGIWRTSPGLSAVPA